MHTHPIWQSSLGHSGEWKVWCGHTNQQLWMAHWSWRPMISLVSIGNPVVVAKVTLWRGVYEGKKSPLWHLVQGHFSASTLPQTVSEGSNLKLKDPCHQETNIICSFSLFPGCLCPLQALTLLLSVCLKLFLSSREALKWLRQISAEWGMTALSGCNVN